MTDIKVYKGYVNYIIKNLGQYIDPADWEEILRENGATEKGTVKAWKEFALKLYYIHFICLSLCMHMENLIRADKSVAELRKILEELDEFREENGLDPLHVVHYLTDKEALEHMETFYVAPKKKKTTEKTTTGKTTTAATKTVGAKKTTKTTKTTKKGSPTTKATSTAKGKTVAKKTPPAKLPTFLTVKQGKKTVTLTKKEDIIKHIYGDAGMPEKKVVAKKAVAKKGTNATKATKTAAKGGCDSYSVTDLRKMAQEKEIAGRSKMNKAELCKALKIKA